MAGGWRDGADGVMTLPSGRRVRGRALFQRQPPLFARAQPALPPGLEPTYGLYLLGTPPPRFEWPSRWLRWPDFRLPSDPTTAVDAFHDLWRRLDDDRVEIACSGGRGRTGTALACLVVIDTANAVGAVEYVREHYHPTAVETPAQRRYVARFPTA
jgi:Protein-tyrosine phosphatase